MLVFFTKHCEALIQIWSPAKSIKAPKVCAHSGPCQPVFVTHWCTDVVAYAELSRKQPSTALRSSVVRIDGLNGLTGHPRKSRLSIICVGSLGGGLFSPRLPTKAKAS